MFVGHEKVPKVDVKIGLFSPDILERLHVNLRAGVLIEMGIGGQGEAKAPAGETSRMKGRLRTCREL
jgi:hypothetical protein